MRLLLLTIVLFAFCAIDAFCQQGEVNIQIFSSPDCSHCQLVNDRNLLALQEKLGCKIKAERFDISDITNYRLLLEKEKQFSDTNNQVPVVFIGNAVLGGEEEINEGFEKAILNTLNQHESKQIKPYVQISNQPVKSAARPEIFIKSNIIDIGNLKPSQLGKVILVIQNRGSSTLKIERIRTSCECISINPKRLEIEQGKEAEVNLAIDTMGLSGDISKIFYIDSNDPSNPTIAVNVKCIIKPFLSFIPERLDLGIIKRRSKVYKSITANYEYKDVIDIKSIISEDKSIIIKGWKNNADGKSAIIQIAVIAPAQTGRIREHIKIKSKNAIDGEISYSIYANVQ